MTTTESDSPVTQSVVEASPNAGPQVIREDMIATAIRFLENPKVSVSSEDVKRSFLTKKGLTSEEIELSFQRAKPVQVQQQQLSSLSQQQQMVHFPQQQQQSRWQSFRDLANFVVLIGGAIYGLKYLWEKHVYSWLYGNNGKPKTKSVLEKTLELQETIQKAMDALVRTMEQLQNSIDNQSDSVKRLLDGNVGRTQDSDRFNELQRDIQSVKGLLLNSNRFPSNPPILQPPSIPAWQLTSSGSNSSKTLSKADPAVAVSAAAVEGEEDNDDDDDVEGVLRRRRGRGKETPDLVADGQGGMKDSDAGKSGDASSSLQPSSSLDSSSSSATSSTEII